MELIDAADFHLLVLCALSDLLAGMAENGRRLQTFSCSVARRMAEYLLCPYGPGFSAFVFSNVCDMIWNLPEE